MTTSTPPPPMPPHPEPPTGAAPPPPARPPLRRSRTDKVIGGVSGGLAENTGIDALLWRVGFIALVFAGGTGFLVYLLLWLLMPARPLDPADARSTGHLVDGERDHLDPRLVPRVPHRRDDRLDAGAGATQPCRGRGEAERLAPEVVRAQEDDVHGAVKTKRLYLVPSLASACASTARR